MNRLVQTRKSATDSSTYKVTDRTYNKLGLLQKVCLPYFASGRAKEAATTTWQLFTNYTYNAVRRVTTSTTALGSTNNFYDNWKTTVTDSVDSIN